MSKSKQQKTTTRIRDVRQKIRATMIGQETVDVLCHALLDSGADFVDPIGSMRKSSDEVVEFLRFTSNQVTLWADLQEGRRALLKTICDVYCRELAAQKEDA